MRNTVPSNRQTPIFCFELLSQLETAEVRSTSQILMGDGGVSYLRILAVDRCGPFNGRIRHGGTRQLFVLVRI